MERPHRNQLVADSEPPSTKVGNGSGGDGRLRVEGGRWASVDNQIRQRGWLGCSEVIQPEDNMRQKTIIVLSGMALLGLAVSSAAAQVSVSDRAVGTPLVSLWRTGGGMGVYHNVFADCDTILHGYGRNAAWGSWTMPRSAVSVDVVAAEAAAVLVFRCLDSSPCIAERLRGNRTLTEHRVLVSVRERADRFAEEMAEIAVGCAEAASSSKI